MGSQVSVEADRIKYTRGGGCLTLLGVPFLLMGLLFLLVSLGSSEGLTGGMIVVLAIGAFMTVVGGGLAFGRGGAIVDRRRGRVTEWWGLLVPLHRKHTPLAELGRVAVSGVTRRTKGGWFTVYYLCLEGPTGKSVKLTYGLSEPLIQQRAAQLSKFLAAADAEGAYARA